MLRFSLPLSFLLVVMAAPLVGKMTRFEIRDAAQRDVVQFNSDTALEKVAGLSSGIAGWMEIDPELDSQGVRGEFEVDVRTFDTGNPLRNDYLKEKFLNAAEFPLATYTLNKLLRSDKMRLLDQQPVVLRVEGSLKFKGVIKSQPVLLKLTYFKNSEQTKQRLGGNLLRIASNFDLDLNLFGIVIPESLRFRLSRFLQINVDVVGSDALAAQNLAIPEGIKPK